MPSATGICRAEAIIPVVVCLIVSHAVAASAWRFNPPIGNIVQLKNGLTQTLLSVCNSCNGIPEFSVDVHVNSSDVNSDASWNVVDAGDGGIGLRAYRCAASSVFAPGLPVVVFHCWWTCIMPALTLPTHPPGSISRQQWEDSG